MNEQRLGFPKNGAQEIEARIPDVYREIDSDLARDNMDNDFDLSPADLQDLQRNSTVEDVDGIK